MSFSARTITHSFVNADGTPASGSVEFTLSERMTNGSTTMVPASITTNLDNSGNLSQSITCTDDEDTTPSDAKWRVDFRILGADPETFVIVVPSGEGSVDLGSLLPGNQQVA